MKYAQVNLKQTIDEVSRMAEVETDQNTKNVLFSARDYLEVFQTDTENRAVSWESILECRKKKNVQTSGGID